MTPSLSISRVSLVLDRVCYFCCNDKLILGVHDGGGGGGWVSSRLCKAGSGELISEIGLEDVDVTLFPKERASRHHCACQKLYRIHFYLCHMDLLHTSLATINEQAGVNLTLLHIINRSKTRGNNDFLTYNHLVFMFLFSFIPLPLSHSMYLSVTICQLF